AKVFVTSAATSATAQAVEPLLKPDVVRFMAGGAATGWRSWEEAIAGQPEQPIDDEIVGYDMLYSSGTTGRPKGVKPAFGNEKLGWV
ncbi:hypothetical protein ABTM45_19395, partial [Acinetobacter baumannii]